MRFLYRWIANGLAFYLTLYLVDSLVAPRFLIERGWIAIVLAILLGGANSFIRPFPDFRTRRVRALTVMLLTVVGNMLFMEREALKPIIPIRLLDEAIRDSGKLRQELEDKYGKS